MSRKDSEDIFILACILAGVIMLSMGLLLDTRGSLLAFALGFFVTAGIFILKGD